MTSRQADTTIAAIALAVGAGAAIAPAKLMRLYGVPEREMTGIGALGWRLFAMRNLVIGIGILRGDRSFRDCAVTVQALDQMAFLHGLRSGELPKPAALGAMATSGVIVALGLGVGVRDDG